jgi:hypothetical protein
MGRRVLVGEISDLVPKDVPDLIGAIELGYNPAEPVISVFRLRNWHVLYSWKS